MVKKLKKQFETPNEGWNQQRMEEEERLQDEYGLKNKEEVYKAYSQLRSLRRQARNLASSEDETQRNQLIEKANRLGLVKKDANLEDILGLNVRNFLDRRLQTVVNRKGLTETVYEARQKVVHGHVYIDGQRVNIPSYLLTQEEEKNVELIEPENTEEVEKSEKEKDEGETEEGEGETK